MGLHFILGLHRKLSLQTFTPFFIASRELYLEVLRCRAPNTRQLAFILLLFLGRNASITCL